MKHKKKTFVLSFGYWYGAHSLGLLLHPYQSVRRIMREGIYEPLVALPSVSLVLWWTLAFLVSRLDVLSSVGLGFVMVPLDRLGVTQIVLSFGFAWGVVMLSMWQVLLIYLWWRFRGLKN